MSLDETIDRLVGREGKYSDHPADTGKATMWGVTEAVARRNGYTGPMQTMPRATAVAIYKSIYWHVPHFDVVADASPKIAEEMLDTGVNQGVSWPGRYLQRALNVLNKGESLFPDLKVDGDVGGRTIEALRAFLAARGTDGETVLLRMLNAQQAVRYMEIAEGNETSEAFTFGWVLQRVGDLG